MAKLNRLEVKVRGSGRFPLDMLRYDRLAPESEEDSALICKSWGEYSPEPFTVSLVGWQCKGDSFPSSVTVGRWNSFSWSVIEVKREGMVIMQGTRS